MPWWAWIVAGLALLGLELLVGTLYFIFLGVAALAVGVVAYFTAGAAWLQWLLFTVLALGSMVLFRRPLLERLKLTGDAGAVDNLVGEVAVLTAPLPPGGIGKAEMRGTSWNVRNAGSEPLEAGLRVRVERVEGLLLWVRKESS
jgi:hypothetical protein